MSESWLEVPAQCDQDPREVWRSGREEELSGQALLDDHDGGSGHRDDRLEPKLPSVPPFH